MTIRRLRDGLLWLNGRAHSRRELSSTDTWANDAAHLAETDGTPGSAATFIGWADGHWDFTNTTNEEITVAHHDSLDAGQTGGLTVLVRCEVGSGSDNTGVIVGKKNTTTSSSKGWALYRSGLTENVALQVSDATTNPSVTGSITYDTAFVAAMRWVAADKQAELFVDGVSQGTTTAVASADIAAGSGIPLYLGRVGSSDIQQIDGRVYSVAVFYEALTDAQIVAFGNQMVTPPAEFTIGRTTIVTPNPPVLAGDMLSFRSDINPGSVTTAKMVRQQLLGYQPGDRVNVVWSEDSTIDGFYEVVNPFAVETIPVSLSSGLMFVEGRLRRVTNGYGLPSIEVSAMSEAADGTEQYSGTMFPVIGMPGSFTSGGNFFGTSGGDGRYRAIDGVYMNAFGTATGGSARSDTGTFVVPPAAATDNQAVIETSDADGNWWPMVGRQLAAEYTGNPNRVRLSTGAYRVIWDRAGAFNTEVLSDHGWVDAGTFELVYNISDPRYVPIGVFVFENRDGTCVLGFSWYNPTGGSTTKGDLSKLTLMARSGMHHIEANVTGSPLRIEFRETSLPASTLIGTGNVGSYATSADSFGNRVVVAAPYSSVTNSATDGSMTWPTGAYPAGNGRFMFGIELDGSSAAAHNDADDVAFNDYWNQTGDYRRVISL